MCQNTFWTLELAKIEHTIARSHLTFAPQVPHLMLFSYRSRRLRRAIAPRGEVSS